jgi:hypothetical protein
MAKKRPTRKGIDNMSEPRTSGTETNAPHTAAAADPVYDADQTLATADEVRQPTRRPREDRDGGTELVIVDDGVRLSPDQRRVAQELLRLYQSLCGNQPGQYWPQALLDSAGKFNRPAFPQRGRY